jgi:hypothetical protein
MLGWKGIVGQRFTPAAFGVYCHRGHWTARRPSLIVTAVASRAHARDAAIIQPLPAVLTAQYPGAPAARPVGAAQPEANADAGQA